MRLASKILLIILSVATGSLFLYSAWTKVLPIQPFEYTMVEYLHFPWLVATVAARLMVGLEAALGGLLVLHLFGRNRIILKVAFAMVLVLSAYLIWLWATAGNNVNCGCFGDAIWMSPSASLIKNAGLLLVIGILIRFHNGLSFKRSNALANWLFAAGVALPFILFPMSRTTPNWLNKGSYELDLAPFYNPIIDDSEALKVPYPATAPADLAHGKYVVAFLSPGCEHCRFTARKMALMRRSDSTLPFLMVIGGIASDLSDFWKATNAKNVPWMRMHRDPFLKYTGGVFPLIVWVDNGKVVARSTYNSLNQQAVKDWITGK